MLRYIASKILLSHRFVHKILSRHENSMDNMDYRVCVNTSRDAYFGPDTREHV
jgi:hypothetical protein